MQLQNYTMFSILCELKNETQEDLQMQYDLCFYYDEMNSFTTKFHSIHFDETNLFNQQEFGQQIFFGILSFWPKNTFFQTIVFEFYSKTKCILYKLSAAEHYRLI